MSDDGPIIPLMPPVHELPPAMQALKTDRDRAFCWAYMFNGGAGADAARSAGFSDRAEGAKVRAHERLLRDDIQAALRELCGRYLFSLAPKAVFRLSGLLDDTKHKHHAKAIEMTLSRTGFGERTALDVNVSGRVEVDHTTSAVDDLRRMKQLGVSREKLVEIFGFSGLERYEQLLLAADAKVIEHEEGSRNDA